MRIYLVPGVASDHRLFNRLERRDHAMQVLELPHVEAGTPMQEYARILANKVDQEEQHVLIGMSMGGMIVQEMHALTRPSQLIIISSWKSVEEMPLPLKALRGTHPEKVLTPKLLERMKPLLYWQMGAEDDEDRELIDAFIATMPLDQIKRQLHASLNWEGLPKPITDIIHIHGDNDHLMPIANINGAIAVKEGGHLMVFSKAAEVSALIHAHLDQLG